MDHLQNAYLNSNAIVGLLVSNANIDLLDKKDDINLVKNFAKNMQN